MTYIVARTSGRALIAAVGATITIGLLLLAAAVPSSFADEGPTPPPPVITKPKHLSLVNIARPLISFTHAPGTTTRCATDGGAPLSCNSPYRTPTLADGDHTVTIEARDTAGNFAAASVQFTVDTRSPVVTLTGTPPEGSYVNTTAASFDFESDEAAQLECAFDSTAFSTCSSPILLALSTLPDGPHRFSVRAVDAAGNYSLRRVRNWTIDTTAPSPPQLLQPGELATVTENRPTIAGSSEPWSQVEISVDGQPDTTTTASWNGTWSATIVQELDDSVHAFTARATDRAGNTSNVSTPMHVRIDAESPVASFQSRPGPISNRSNSTFNFTANEQSTFECRVDDFPFGVCAAPVLVSGLSDGAHTFFVRAVDLSGHKSTTIAYTWLIDTTGPIVTVSTNSPPPGISPTFDFDSNEPGTTYKCRIDGSGAFTTCASPFNAPTLPIGAHRLELRATDPVGNTTLRTVNFSILAPPQSSPTSPPQVGPPVQPGPPAAVSCLGIDGTPTPPATVSVVAAKATRRGLRLTVSSDRRALVRIAIKRGARSLARRTAQLPAGRGVITLPIRRSHLRAGLASVDLAALTIGGARSLVDAVLRIGPNGKLTIERSEVASHGGTVCAAASRGRAPRVVVRSKARQKAASKRLGLSVSSHDWVLLSVRVVQGDVVASQVALIAPRRRVSLALKPLRNRTFAKGRADVQLLAMNTDGITRGQKRRIHLQ